ncbi:MAG: endonuclease III [Candidatus Eremiobacteraeota bacterium]|nr:endonuclease III [Candidatus Eremiobacteraeota bacterium]MBV9648045.1 endonuclease III [Candidatus Eremiobacteraeota bacterium]
MRIPFPKRKVTRTVAARELAILEATYPQAATALEYQDPFTLLIAVILSAQTTDAGVNRVTPVLFQRYPTAQALAGADLAEVERIIKPTGFFRVKSRNIVRAAQAVAERFGGMVPSDRESLETVPGVGRKTASVVLSVAFGEAELAVDTHVFRVAHRLGLTTASTPRGVEEDVRKLVPREKTRFAHHWLILHGRAICKAPVPLCARCPENQLCPSVPIVQRALRLQRAQPRRRA